MNFILHTSRVCLPEKQTAKMAEGPDPGQTLAKGEFGTNSAFDKYKEKMSLERFNSIFCCMYHQM